MKRTLRNNLTEAKTYMIPGNEKEPKARNYWRMFEQALLLLMAVLSCAVPAQALTINEINADPDSVWGDANSDGTVHSSQDEFVEIVNERLVDLDISGWTLSDGRSVRHLFPAGTIMLPGSAAVIFGGGIPTGMFGQAIVQTASTGTLSLNNGGDTVTVNGGADAVWSMTYGREGSDNQSLTLDPDITGGIYVKHSMADNSQGVCFSPGMMIDGSPFSAPAPAPVPEPATMFLFGAGLAGLAAIKRSPAHLATLSTGT